MPETLIVPLGFLAVIGVAVLLVALGDLLHVREVKRHEAGERWIAEHPSTEPSQDITAQTHG